jgi:hypothetical protein
MNTRKYEVLQKVIEKRFSGEETEQVMVLVDTLLDEAFNDGAGESEDDDDIWMQLVSEETAELINSLEIPPYQRDQLGAAFWEEKELSWSEGYEAALDHYRA